MTVRRIVFLLFCLILIVGVVGAKGIKPKSAHMVGDIYQIPKTNVAPVIDGLQDDAWKTIGWNFQRIYAVDGTPTVDSNLHEGMSKAMWDDTNLYFLFYSQDPIICDNPAQTAGWQKDGVELYIDAQNSKIPDNVSPDPGGGLPPTDIQLTIPHAFMGTEAANVGALGFPAAMSTAGVEFKITDDDNVAGLGGWWLELKIPLENIDLPAVVDQQIGWEIQQDISDDNTARQWMTKWWSPSNNSWTDASIWGTAQLVEFGGATFDVGANMTVVKTATAPVIDGQLDAAYSAAIPQGMNYPRVDGGGSITDYMFDSYITTYTLWDDNNFYAFFNVTDNILCDNPAQTAGWQKDAVEVYFDPDNSKTPDNVSPDPGGGLAPTDIQLTIPHAFMGTEAANVGAIGFPAAMSTAGVEFIMVDHDMGYNLELKIPLENIDLPAVEGQLLGFEVQKDESDDNTARQSMEKWWSPSNNSWTDASLWGTAILGPSANAIEGQPKVANDFRLEQNYPNPFNPSTQITYSVPKTDKVKLTVYNVLGNQIATLVNQTQTTGTYTTTFNAKNLASGIYFYKLEVGSKMLAKKMMLLK